MKSKSIWQSNYNSTKQ